MYKVVFIIILTALISSCTKQKQEMIQLSREIDLQTKYASAVIIAPSTTYSYQDFKDILIAKEYRWGFFSHPNSTVSFMKDINLTNDFVLNFYVGIDEKAFLQEDNNISDGVEFSITDQNNNVIYKEYIDPVKNDKQLGWNKRSIDVSVSQPITELNFNTKTGKTSINDWAYWADPRIEIQPISRPHKSHEKTNIILFTLDTLRNDYLGCYGNQWIDTPTIDYLAENGVLFEKAYSSSSTTSPSHVSIFTSLNPYVHGVIGNDYHLASKVPTLTKLLNENGYKTGAAVSVFHLNPETSGLKHYFDSYVHPITTEDTFKWKLMNSGYSTVSSGIEFLDQNHNDPFFLWLHLYDAHMPYTPVSEYDKRYYDENPFDQKFTSMQNAFYDQYFDINNEPWMIGVRDLNFFKRQYGAEITYIDDQIKRILEALKRLHIDENTLIIITADHGECLGEHNLYFNHWGLFREETNVPLIFYLPNQLPKNKRYDDLVSINDIAPTVLDIIGDDNNYMAKNSFDGLSLAPVWETNQPLSRESITINSLYYIQTTYIGQQYKVNWIIRKATYNTKHLTLPKDRVLVYDYINDPEEENPVAGFMWSSDNNLQVDFENGDTFHDKVFKIKDIAKLKQVPSVQQLKSLFQLSNPNHFIDDSLKDDHAFLEEVHKGLTALVTELNVDLKDKLKNILDISDMKEIEIQSLSISDPTYRDQMKSLGYFQD